MANIVRSALRGMMTRARGAVDKALLRESIAGPTTTGVRQILSGHPAQGLTPQRLTRLLLEAEQGDATAYLELAEEMEEKDLHYRSVLSTRKLQVSGLPITVAAASDSAEDVRAADLVRDFLDTDILQGALFDTLDAVGKGYSVCEILWDTEGRSWMPSALTWRDPRWFAFEPLDGVTLRLRGESGLLEELAPAKFITHLHKSKSGLPIRGGLARAASWSYLFKNFDIKSWVQFAQVFGFPLRLGRYDSSATEADKHTLLKAVRNISQDAAAILPEGMSIEFTKTDARGNASIFAELAEYFDKQVSKLVLGQTGTTDVGQHVGTADAHERVRFDIARSDAVQLSATLNRDLVRPLIDLNLGARSRYPLLKVVCEEPEDINALVDNVVKIAAVASNFVEISVMRDKLGLPEPAPGAEVIGQGALAPPPKGLSPSGEPEHGAQRASMSVQAAPDAYEDDIDHLVAEEMEGWEPLVSPLVDPIVALVERSSSFEEFEAGLADALQAQNPDALARELSLAMFAEYVKAAGNG